MDPKKAELAAYGFFWWVGQHLAPFARPVHLVTSFLCLSSNNQLIMPAESSVQNFVSYCNNSIKKYSILRNRYHILRMIAQSFAQKFNFSA